MASQNDIGSLHQRMPNPLRPLGIIELLAGLATVYMSAKLLLGVSTLVASGKNPAAWLAAVIGLFIIFQGGYMVFSGMFKCFSLVVGRNDPKSLAHNYANPGESQRNMHYSAADLSQMLLSRQNKTFVEPRNWIEGLYFTLFRRMFFLPLPYRNIMQGCFSAVISTLVILLCWGILNFVVSTGLAARENGDLVINLCTIVLGVKLFFIWRQAYAVERNRISSANNLSFRHFIMTIAFALLVPGLIATCFSFVSLPDYQIVTGLSSFITGYDWQYWFLCFAFLPLLTLIPIFYMGYRKTGEYNLKTEVSERIVSWQESVHPREVFIGIENSALAKRRFMEIPNRVYSKLEPRLTVQSGGDKGEFSGFTLQETQPVFAAEEQSVGFNIVRYLTCISAALLQLGIFYLLSRYVTDFTFSWNGSFENGLVLSVLGLLLSVLLFWDLFRILKGASLLFFSEMKFSSLLVYYKTEGTFAESKISTGAGIYDSNRSENSIIRSSINQWVIVSRITSVSFLGTALYKFDNARYVMEMDGDNSQIDAILGDLQTFVKSREVVADVAESQESAKVAQHIQEMNAQALSAIKAVHSSPAMQTVSERIPGDKKADLNIKGPDILPPSARRDEAGGLDDITDSQ